MKGFKRRNEAVGLFVKRPWWLVTLAWQRGHRGSGGSGLEGEVKGAGGRWEDVGPVEDSAVGWLWGGSDRATSKSSRKRSG